MWVYTCIILCGCIHVSYARVLICYILQLLENEQRVHDLKVQLTTLQGNHKESMEQLGDKSQQVAILKTEISRLQQQNNAITDEVMDNMRKIDFSVCKNKDADQLICTFVFTSWIAQYLLFFNEKIQASSLFL